MTAAPASAAPVVTNGSFEAPALGAGGFQYTPNADFNSKAGIAANGSPFASAPASDGTQFAFLQSVDGAQGMFSLAVSGLTIGSAYTFSFDAAQRPTYASNVVTLSFNGIVLGSYDATSTAFSSFTTSAFVALGGSGTLTFTGAKTTTGDNDVAIDNVRMTAATVTAAVPEPATWGMMLIGFGALGAALRRHGAAVRFAGV